MIGFVVEDENDNEGDDDDAKGRSGNSPNPKNHHIIGTEEFNFAIPAPRIPKNDAESLLPRAEREIEDEKSCEKDSWENA